MEDKKKKQPLRYQWLIRLVQIVAVGCGLIYFGSFAIFTMNMDNACRWNDALTFERYAHIALPQSIQNVTTQCSGFKGWMAFAQFDISPEDVPRLIDGLILPHQLTATSEQRLAYVGSYGGVNEAYPHMQSTLYSFSNDGYTVQEILIDTSNPEQYTVYLLVMGG